MKKVLLVFGLFFLTTSCYKDEIDANSLQIEQIKQELNDINSEINRINNLISSNTIEIGIIKSRLDKVESDIDDLDSFVDELRVDVIELNSSINFITNYIQDLSSDVDLLGDSLNETNLLLIGLQKDYELLEYILNYLIQLQSYQDSLSDSQISSLVNDIISVIEYYNIYGDLNQGTTSLIGHIKSKILMNGVSKIHWGKESTPGTIQTDCNWVRILSDSKDNLVSALNPYNNTLLLGHHADIGNISLNDTPNDSFKFYKNFFQSPKKILYIGLRHSSEISIYLDYLKSLGHSVTYVRILKNEYNTNDVPELSAENLDKYQGLILDDGISRHSSEIQNNLKQFFENPTKSSIVVSLGWVWTHYKANYVGEKYPLNNVMESIGAKFITWNGEGYSYDTYNFMNYYPNTYNENTPSCN